MSAIRYPDTSREIAAATVEIAHKKSAPISRGQIEQKSCGQIGASLIAAKQLQRKNAGIAHKKTEQKASGQIENKWFRFELDLREASGGGYTVLIRKRLRWLESKKGRTLTTRRCANLTAGMVKKLRAGRITEGAKAAFEQGGINRELIEILNKREGRGRGKRASQLTDDERSFLARLEHGLASGDGKRRDDTGAPTGRDNDLPHSDVPGASDGNFADVSNLPEWEM